VTVPLTLLLLSCAHACGTAANQASAWIASSIAIRRNVGTGEFNEAIEAS
jgi:hypothetical protein